MGTAPRIAVFGNWRKYGWQLGRCFAVLGRQELQRILEKARPTRRHFAEVYLETTRHTGIVREDRKSVV